MINRIHFSEPKNSWTKFEVLREWRKFCALSIDSKSMWNSSFSEAIKMKILQSVQHNFATLGINLSQPIQQHPLNLKRLLIILVFGTANTLNYVSIFQAHSFKEYIDSIHVGLALTLGSTLFGIILFQRTKISELIRCFEKIVNNSECI